MSPKKRKPPEGGSNRWIVELAICKILAISWNQLYLQAANDEMDENGKSIYDVHPKGDWRIFGVADYRVPVRNEL